MASQNLHPTLSTFLSQPALTIRVLTNKSSALTLRTVGAVVNKVLSLIRGRDGSVILCRDGSRIRFRV